MFVADGKTIRVGKAFTLNGIQYPANWLHLATERDKELAGISWVPDPEPYDGRFYWGRNESGTLLPKRLEDEPAVDENGDAVLDGDGEQVINTGLKTEWVQRQKEIAGSLLSPSDWYVTRKAEDPTAEIPAAVSTYRAAVRTTCGTREGEINACTTTEELVALLTNPPTIQVQSEDEVDEFGVAVWTTVANTEPFITPWPEQG